MSCTQIFLSHVTCMLVRSLLASSTSLPLLMCVLHVCTHTCMSIIMWHNSTLTSVLCTCTHYVHAHTHTNRYNVNCYALRRVMVTLLYVPNMVYVLSECFLTKTSGQAMLMKQGSFWESHHARVDWGGFSRDHHVSKSVHLQSKLAHRVWVQ